MATYGHTFTSGDTVTPTKLNNARTISDIQAADISDAQITAAKLAANAVETAKINASAVTTAKLADANVTFAKLESPQYTGFRNRIINGDFKVAARSASFTSTNGANNDDAYTLDRWYILSDGNDVIDVTQESSVIPTNGLYAIALDVETTNKKFGIAQIIEQQNCLGLIGGNVTLSFKAKVSATTKLDNVKAAIVAWSGAADTVTSKIISAWGAEGTNPTLIANATYENTPVNLNVTTSYATYTLTANVDTVSTKNIIVFIWSDVTDTTLGEFLYITDVQLESGLVATPFEARPIGTELALCQRYYTGATYLHTANVAANIAFPVFMRTAPTITISQGAGNTVSAATISAGGFKATTASGLGDFTWNANGAEL